eukprot:scaffold7028_cov243-Pinguiococcus_pyrenoidosus.AAC.12
MQSPSSRGSMSTCPSCGCKCPCATERVLARLSSCCRNHVQKFKVTDWSRARGRGCRRHRSLVPRQLRHHRSPSHPRRRSADRCQMGTWWQLPLLA